MCLRAEEDDMHKKQPPFARTWSHRSQEPDGEHDPHTPGGVADVIGKAGEEAKHERGPVNKMKAVGREVDRIIAGEYEARDERAEAAEKQDAKR